MKAHFSHHIDTAPVKAENQEGALEAKNERHPIQGNLTQSEMRAVHKQNSAVHQEKATKHLPEIHMDQGQVGCIDRKGGRMYFEYNLDNSLKSMTDNHAGGLSVRRAFDGHWYDQNNRVYQAPQIDMKTGNVTLVGRGGDKTTFELDGTVTTYEKHIQSKDILRLHGKNSRIMDMNGNGRLEVGEIDAAMNNPYLAGGEDRQFVRLLHDNRSMFAKGKGESMFHAVHRDDIVKLQHRVKNATGMSKVLDDHFSKRLDKILKIADTNHTGTITSRELRNVLNNWSKKTGFDRDLDSNDKKIVEKLLRNYTETRNLADHKLESKARGISRADLTEFHRNLILADGSKKSLDSAITKVQKGK